MTSALPFIYRYVNSVHNAKDLVSALFSQRYISHEQPFQLRNYPGRRFTLFEEKLNELRDKYPEFEIEFMSRDKIHEELTPHMKEMGDAIEHKTIISYLNGILHKHTRIGTVAIYPAYSDSQLRIVCKATDFSQFNIEDRVEVGLLEICTEKNISFKSKRCKTCHGLYPYKLERSEFCSLQCRNAHAYQFSTKLKRERRA